MKRVTTSSSRPALSQALSTLCLAVYLAACMMHSGVGAFDICTVCASVYSEGRLSWLCCAYKLFVAACVSRDTGLTSVFLLLELSTRTGRTSVYLFVGWRMPCIVRYISGWAEMGLHASREGRSSGSSGTYCVVKKACSVVKRSNWLAAGPGLVFFQKQPCKQNVETRFIRFSRL